MVCFFCKRCSVCWMLVSLVWSFLFFLVSCFKCLDFVLLEFDWGCLFLMIGWIGDIVVDLRDVKLVWSVVILVLYWLIRFFSFCIFCVFCLFIVLGCMVIFFMLNVLSCVLRYLIFLMVRVCCLFRWVWVLLFFLLDFLGVLSFLICFSSLVFFFLRDLMILFWLVILGWRDFIFFSKFVELSCLVIRVLVIFLGELNLVCFLFFKYVV